MSEQYELASWPIRAAAYVIDNLIFSVAPALFVGGMIIAAGVEGGFDTNTQFQRWFIPIFGASAAVAIGCFVWWLIALKDGQTPGKKLIGIRVVNAYTGETLGWGMMFVREFLVKFLLFGMLASATCYIAGLLNLLWPLWDDKSQTLHDKIVNTCVIYD